MTEMPDSGYVIGIDGGGSASHGIVVDASGKVVAKSKGGPLNFYTTSDPIFRGNLEQLMSELKRPLANRYCLHTVVGTAALMDVPDDQELKRAFGGFDLPDRKQLTLVGDAVTAAFGATKGAPGVLIISGTGSIAVSIVSQDGYDFSGGLGPLIGGDPGSAFWMAAEAVQLAFRNQAATGALCAIGIKVVEYFEISRLSLIIPILYNRDFNSGRLAGLSCFLCNELLVENSREWLQIQKAAGKRLAELALPLIQKLNLSEIPIFGTGSGIRNNSIVRGSLEETLSVLLERNIVIQKPQMDAPSGAALLAFQKAGITIGDETFQGFVTKGS